MGGVIVGLLLGWLISRLISQVDDYLIETTLTTRLVLGSYLPAERLHFSGVLEVWEFPHHPRQKNDETSCI